MTTRRSIFALALVLPLVFGLLPGCGGGGSDFVGQWEIDPDAMRALIEADMPEEEGMTDADRMAREMALSMAASMQMTFDIREDNTFLATIQILGQNETESGTWSVSGGTITLEDSEGSPSSRGTGTIEGGLLVIRPAENSGQPDLELRLRRKAG
ncbi:MAG: hypothetical protein AAGB48_05585 [Planctomycetota bacterium]